MKTSIQMLKKANWLDIGLSFLALLAMFPNPYHTIEELDASWQAVLEHAFFNQWQFGKDIIFTGGPLSFLYTPTSIGYYPKTQVILEAIVLFFAIFSVQYAARKQHWAIRILAFVILACGAATSRDGIYLVAVTAVALILLKTQTFKARHYGFITLAAILGLMKFTTGILGFSSLLVVAIFKLWQKETKEAVLIIATYLTTVVLTWILIGQSILNLPAYIYHSWSLSQGYAWGMHLHEPPEFFKFLMLILLSTSLPVFAWTLVRNDRKAWAILLVTALGVYVSWKTGITRYGTHVFYFLQVAALIPILQLSFIRNKRNGYLWASGCALLFIWSNFSLFPTNADTLKSRIQTQATFGLKFIGSAGNEVKKFSDLVPYVKMSHTLHKIKEQVGDDNVDVLYYHHGILLLNELNYHPRPTIQNYAAYNDHLMRWNLQHMQENPPKYILCKDGEIDARYPATADSLYLKEVLENYAPVLKENGWLLLGRTSNPSSLSETVLREYRTINDGEEVDISEYTGRNLWVRISYDPSLLHKAASFLYKPEILVMKVTYSNGDSKLYRLIGNNLRNGFLLSPTLQSMNSIERFLKSEPDDFYVSKLSIHSSPGVTPSPTREFKIEISEITRSNLTTVE